jgi:hypothetical protein
MGKKFQKVDRMDCQIITFDVDKKVFFACARQGQRTLTTRSAKILN